MTCLTPWQHGTRKMTERRVVVTDVPVSADLPVPATLISGAGQPREDGTGGCVMNWVTVRSRIRQGMSLSDALSNPTDAPSCTDPLIRYAAIGVNDRSLQEDRDRLCADWRLDRIEQATTPADPVKARRVRVRVSCWAARSVLHLIKGEERRAVALQAIETAEAWLRGEATENDCAAASATADAAADHAAYAYVASAASADAAASAADYVTASAAYATASAASAAYAATAYATASAASATSAYATADAAADLIEWFDELLDAWEKACQDEDVFEYVQVGGS